MREHKKFIQKGIILSLLVVLTVGLTNKVLMPKYYYDNIWPTTTTFADFYNMEKNTVDILFFGSSHGVSAFSPQKLYDDFSLKSYNLSSEQQNLFVSYYWLKEALKYQSPKVVVLDTCMLYSYKPEYVLNTTEATTRKAIDSMRWSKNKVEAINDLAALDESQVKASYYFSNIRFHTRWKELNEDDFTFLTMEKHGGLKGFSALSGYCMYEDFVPFKAGTSEEKETMHPLMKEYLDRIVQLCKTEEITLILTKTPALTTNIAKYNTLMEYAKVNEIPYIDYNEETVYQAMDFDFSKDAHDNVHLNIWGAEKATEYMGNYLENYLKIEPSTDAQWESTSAYYANIKKNCELTKIDDIKNYLRNLKDERYTVFMCVKDEGFNSLDSDSKAGLKELGLTTNFDRENALLKSYYAIIDQGDVTELMSDQLIETSGSIREGREWYKIISARNGVGNYCSINISGEEYAKNLRGFNIVVYDNDLKKVIDSVAFDTFDVNLTATR